MLIRVSCGWWYQHEQEERVQLGPSPKCSGKGGSSLLGGNRESNRGKALFSSHIVRCSSFITGTELRAHPMPPHLCAAEETWTSKQLQEEEQS